jgi:hypothetical protein
MPEENMDADAPAAPAVGAAIVRRRYTTSDIVSISIGPLDIVRQRQISYDSSARRPEEAYQLTYSAQYDAQMPREFWPRISGEVLSDISPLISRGTELFGDISLYTEQRRHDFVGLMIPIIMMRLLDDSPRDILFLATDRAAAVRCRRAVLQFINRLEACRVYLVLQTTGDYDYTLRFTRRVHQELEVVKIIRFAPAICLQPMMSTIPWRHFSTILLETPEAFLSHQLCRFVIAHRESGGETIVGTHNSLMGDTRYWPYVFSPGASFTVQTNTETMLGHNLIHHQHEWVTRQVIQEEAPIEDVEMRDVDDDDAPLRRLLAIYDQHSDTFRREIAGANVSAEGTEQQPTLEDID